MVYLRRAQKKDFVIHTKWVMRSMEMLLKKEKGDKRILMAAAILHDTGWADVPKDLQMVVSGSEAKKALELHLKYAPAIARKILRDNGYSEKEIAAIVAIILSHKFKNPRDLAKRLLIDADTLSDIFKEPFYLDAKAYNKSPRALLEFRQANRFYAKNAQMIFDCEFKKRQREIENEK